MPSNMRYEADGFDDELSMTLMGSEQSLKPKQFLSIAPKVYKPVFDANFDDLTPIKKSKQKVPSKLTTSLPQLTTTLNP